MKTIKRSLKHALKSIRYILCYLSKGVCLAKKKKIYLILTVKNESYHLPSFLKHVSSYVDGIVALDDGSTDNTVDILRAEPRMIDVLECEKHDSIDWDERGNREKAIRRAYELGADWVLCADPDERFERAFLKRLRIFANVDNCCYVVNFRELWGGYDTWRCDGVWGKKRKDIFFPLSENMTFDHENKHHFSWAYKEILKNRKFINYSMYHMKMINKNDRIKRSELYNQLDPEKTMQAIGYDYLVDETGLQLKKVCGKQKYDFSHIPEDMKA